MDQIRFSHPEMLPLGYEEKKQAQYETNVAKDREQYARLSVEMPPLMKEHTERLQMEFAALHKRYSAEEVPDVQVCYIPIERIDEVRKFNVDISSLAVSVMSARTVVVFAYPNMPHSLAVQFTAHELAHCYGAHKRTVHPMTVEDSGQKIFCGVAFGSAQEGLTVHTAPKNKKVDLGWSLEEFYAMTKELESIRTPEFVQSFHADLENRAGLLETLRSQNGIAPESEPYLYGFKKKQDGSIEPLINQDWFMHVTVSDIFKQVPNSFALLEESRFTGNYSPIQSALDSHYGIGFYKLLMHGGKDREYLTQLKNYIRLASDERAPVLKQLLEKYT